MNFDMVASPNFTHFVYDGDGSSFGIEGPSGSATVESLLREHFDQLGIEARDSALDGRSDYWAFMNAGVPVGGTFTGAEGAKTNDEAESFGGEADSAYDACYHAACDTVENVALDALENNATAAAFAVERLASDTSLLAR
jgi:aminopeptidase S